MAYLVELRTRCQMPYAHCGKYAVLELFDHRNESRGKYCREHGNGRLCEQKDKEVTAFAEPAQEES